MPCSVLFLASAHVQHLPISREREYSRTCLVHSSRGSARNLSSISFKSARFSLVSDSVLVKGFPSSVSSSRKRRSRSFGVEYLIISENKFQDRKSTRLNSSH